jgi:hypothetical protein
MLESEMKQRNLAGNSFTGHGARISMSVMELRLLVRILARDSAGVARSLEGRPELVGKLAETCNRSGLSVVLLRALEESPLRLALTPHRIERLNEALNRQKERQRVLGQALLSLAELFESKRQPFILLKGAYLASRFYGGILGREFVDIDLLVPRADRSKACTLLREADFHRYSQILLGEGLTSFFVHAFDFRSDAVDVDLHWDLSRHPSLLRLDERRLWALRGSFEIEGRSYDVLSDEHEVIFAALSLLRDIERGRPKPKNVIDLIQIVTATDSRLDWDVVFSARDGTARPLVNVLGQCLEIGEARDLAPNLTAALDRHRRSRVPATTGIGDSPLQFRPVRFSLGNKLWAARLYETNLPAWLAWWAISLPFRLAVHRKPPQQFRHQHRG